MKVLLAILFCFFVNLSFTNELYKIKIEKSQKVMGTLSAELSDNATIHFVFTKNSSSKKFEIIPIFIDSDKKSKQLDSFQADEMPDILSYHRNNSIVTLSNFYEKKKELQRIDFDVISGEFHSSITKDFSKPKNIFRLSNQTIFVDFDKMKNNVSIASFSDAKEIKREKFEFTKENFNNFSSFFSETPEEINQNEFVKNGSISKRKSYFSNNKLNFTYEKDKSNVQVLTLHLDGSKQYKFDDFNFNYSKEIKEQNTFVADNLLLSVAVSKEDVTLNAFEINTMKASKSISLQNDVKQKLDSDSRQKFIESSAKSSMRPTVTVNKTKDPNKLLVRMDLVNKSTYTYNHNWWHIHWMMQHQMMMQQQMMMRQSIPRGFGPNSNFYDEIAMIYSDKSDVKPIEFIVDLNLTIDETASPATIYKAIEQDDYLDKFKDDKNVKEFSASFTASDFRYIYYDKKTESIYLKTENL
jgi:hypothetical protein